MNHRNYLTSRRRFLTVAAGGSLGLCVSYLIDFDNRGVKVDPVSAGTINIVAYFSRPGVFVRGNGEADIVAQGPNNSLLYYHATPSNPWTVNGIV